ncbi:hypothetical protein CB1_001518004 [Camelus ferus]|nr:hypothetical protein CB1_001518004 [Camelus ferus]
MAATMTVTPGPGEQTVDAEAHINIGLRFQAEIPELQDVSALAQDTHKATLVWKPWPELENHNLQQRVENLPNFCCSSASPGGGTNSEFALHSLFEAKGDVMAALEMLLLLRKPKMVKSKMVAQCMEHYYTWKASMRLGQKHRTRLAEIIDDCVMSEEGQRAPTHPVQAPGQPSGSFICEMPTCGAVTSS